MDPRCSDGAQDARRRRRSPGRQNYEGSRSGQVGYQVMDQQAASSGEPGGDTARSMSPGSTCRRVFKDLPIQDEVKRRYGRFTVAFTRRTCSLAEELRSLDDLTKPSDSEVTSGAGTDQTCANAP